VDSCRDTTIGPTEGTPLSYADAMATASHKVTALEPPVRSKPSVVLGFRRDARDSPGKGLAFPYAFVSAWAEWSCSSLCSNTADFADVRACSPVSTSLVALKIRSFANCGEHAAGDWGSRGRRFKSCHPDGKKQHQRWSRRVPRPPLMPMDAPDHPS
jgi:hypothetical protein